MPACSARAADAAQGLHAASPACRSPGGLPLHPAQHAKAGWAAKQRRRGLRGFLQLAPSPALANTATSLSCQPQHLVLQRSGRAASAPSPITSRPERRPAPRPRHGSCARRQRPARCTFLGRPLRARPQLAARRGRSPLLPLLFVARRRRRGPGGAGDDHLPAARQPLPRRSPGHTLAAGGAGGASCVRAPLPCRSCRECRTCVLYVLRAAGRQQHWNSARGLVVQRILCPCHACMLVEAAIQPRRRTLHVERSCAGSGGAHVGNAQIATHAP